MFDIGWSELLVIGVVALIAIGPKELPGVLRMIGQWTGKMKRMAAEFQGQFHEAMREAEMADVKKTFDDVRADVAATTGDLNPTNILADIQADAAKVDSEINRAVETSPAPGVAAPVVPAAPAGDAQPSGESGGKAAP